MVLRARSACRPAGHRGWRRVLECSHPDTFPGARIIVIEPFWYTDERPPSVEIIITWVKDAAAAIGADYIPGASHWIEHHREWMASDGLHPNDAGYAEMAKRMDAELKNLGL